MTMTKRHFEAIARAVYALDVDDILKAKLAGSLARELQQYNPNFNADKFFHYCLEGPRNGQTRLVESHTFPYQ